MSGSPGPFDDAVFAQQELLHPSYTPDDPNRIIGRQDKLTQLYTALEPAVNARPPTDALLLGNTGTGKSLCLKYTLQAIQEEADTNNTSIGIAHIDCMQRNNEYQAISHAGRTLNNEEVTGVTFPSAGLSSADLYDRLWTVLNEAYDVGIIVLDELECLDTPGEVLGTLSRAAPSQKIPDSHLGIIGITNDPSLKQELPGRVLSSFTPTEISFPPYAEDTLYDILMSRRDAFHEDALPADDGEAVISLTASLAAREYGDARKALHLLRVAGENAQMDGEIPITEDHVREALNEIAGNDIEQIVEMLPEHQRLVLRAVALETQHEIPDEDITSRDVYSAYETVCGDAGVEPVSWRRVRDFLSNLAGTKLIDQNRTGGGRAAGGYNAITLLKDPDDVFDALNEENTAA